MAILATGAVWQSEYELYAHSAAARKAGISGNAIRTLAAGGLPDDLSEQETVAQRYARQFSAEHRVDADLYSAAVRAFGEKGVVDLTYLSGHGRDHHRGDHGRGRRQRGDVIVGAPAASKVSMPS